MPDNFTIRENVIDRIVRFIDPVKAERRFRARAMLALSGSYIGASRSKRSLSQWRTSWGDADSDTLYDLPVLRDRSRDLIRNAPLATGAVNTVCTNVVGTGLKLQSRIDREALCMDEDEADAWESNTEREFRLWAESQECDAARTLTFAGVQNLVFRSSLESGDVFILMPYIERSGSPYGLKLQAIEGDRVCNESNAPDGLEVSGGVKKDSYGAPLAYHIMDQHPGSILGLKKRSWTVVPAFGSVSGRRNVLHIFWQLRPGQTRGVPYLAPVIEPLKQLDRYTEAELMAAVISGMFTVFIKTETGDGDLSPMSPLTEVGGKSTDEDYKLASGAIVGLAPGEDIAVADPKRPNTAFDPFVLAILRQIGVSLELPFEVLVKHFTASYSAARAALLEAWKFFATRRHWLAVNFCQPVYEAWMEEAVSMGRISAPGFFDDPLVRKAYLGTEWVGPAKGMIDERAEVEAAQMRVDMGISTLAEETAALTAATGRRSTSRAQRNTGQGKRPGLSQINRHRKRCSLRLNLTERKPLRLIDIITSPWAIQPEKLVEIRGIYETHLRGEKIDIKAVEARIGKPLDNRPGGYEVVDGVAVIPVDGVIAKRMNLFTQVSGGVSTDLLARDLKAAIDDPSIRAIVLAIDSPGGTVDGTVDIARLVFESRGVKPIVAYTDGTMASAAYWIGSATDKVYIGNDATLVGSIGVVAMHQDVSKAEEQRGIKTTEVYAGRYKRIASQYAPLSEEGRAYLQDRVDYLYSVFVSAVADYRGVSVEKVLKGMADGRVFSGKQAIEAGLVDGVATLDSLIADLKTGGSPGIQAKEVIMAEEKKEDSVAITAELIAEKYPDIQKSIRDEGYKAGLTEGATAERERIRGVFSLLRPGREKLVSEFMFDGKSTKADASVAILEADDAKKEAHLKAIKEDAGAIKVPQAEPGLIGDSPVTREKRIAELVEAYIKENGCSDKEALLAVSKQHPELFRERR